MCLRKLYVLTEQKLSKEWDTYQTNALVPVWQLKEDLKLELSKMQHYLLKESCQKPKINSAEMLQQVGILTLFLQFTITIFLAFSVFFFLLNFETITYMQSVP